MSSCIKNPYGDQGEIIKMRNEAEICVQNGQHIAFSLNSD